MRGEAVLEVEPEIATVAVTIVSQDADRARALRLLDERARANDTVLDGFRDAIEKVETSAVRISPQLRDGKPRERLAGYVATVRQTLTVGDFTRLGELLARLADQDLTEVAGPWWALRPGTAALRDARAAAVADLLRRARDYAGALGSELVALVELADSGLLADSGNLEPPMRLMAARGGGPAPDSFTFDIAPARQVVRATVEGRFRMSPPDLGSVSST